MGPCKDALGGAPADSRCAPVCGRTGRSATCPNGGVAPDQAPIGALNHDTLWCTGPGLARTVGVAAMLDPVNGDDQVLLVDLVDDSVVPAAGGKESG